MQLQLQEEDLKEQEEGAAEEQDKGAEEEHEEGPRWGTRQLGDRLSGREVPPAFQTGRFVLRIGRLFDSFHLGE